MPFVHVLCGQIGQMIEPRNENQNSQRNQAPNVGVPMVDVKSALIRLEPIVSIEQKQDLRTQKQGQSNADDEQNKALQIDGLFVQKRK